MKPICITLDSETSEILTDAGRSFVAVIVRASPPDDPHRFELIATPMPEDEARAFIAKLETRTT